MIPEETMQPRAEIMVNKSVHILHCPKAQYLSNQRDINHYLHILIDMRVGFYTIEPECDQRDNKKKSENDA